MEEIGVSINCITYNHSLYIRDAIESFLMQETNFKIEILIHDDASTDGNQEIIKEYQNKYPDIIKPIFQKENQYSKDINVVNINVSRAKGKYIASCEGDDFWTDPYKLQKQFDYMEKHKECSMYCHSAHRMLSRHKKKKRGIIVSKKEKLFYIEDILGKRLKGFPTSSMFYKSKYGIKRPSFVDKVTDFPLTLYLATKGGIYYNPEFMSGYRINSIDSWTSRYINSKENRINHFIKRVEMLKVFNNYTKFQYIKNRDNYT